MLTGARLIYLIVYVSDLAASRSFYEGALGFQVLEEDPASVKYLAGHVIICLNRAADFGIDLSGNRDRSIDITFLVDDINQMRSALESRGVRFSRTLTYEVGSTADFYDPDGHWFSLYEPSEASLTWPSGEKIRALLSSNNGNRVRSNGSLAPAVAGDTQPADDLGLEGHELVYLFAFVHDPDSSLAFYHEVLGLEAIEGGPCKRGVTRLPAGVVKYDAGGTLLTTHYVDQDHAAAHRVTSHGTGGVTMVFHTTDIHASVAQLSSLGLTFAPGLVTSELGLMARFEDPSGHVYYLCEPSEQTWTRPSGSKIEQILSARL